MSTAFVESDFAGGGLDQIVLRLRPNIKLSDRQFFDICHLNGQSGFYASKPMTKRRVNHHAASGC